MNAYSCTHVMLKYTIVSNRQQQDRRLSNSCKDGETRFCACSTPNYASCGLALSFEGTKM